MCIIIYKPKGKKLNKDILQESYRCNSHGSGYMYVDNGKIIIDKGMDKFEDIYNRYKVNVIDRGLEEDKVVVWHFRIKTHGKVDKENCHPFYVNNGSNYAFAHNGTIRNIQVPKDSELSDTVIFRDKILNNLPVNWFRNLAIRLLMYNFIEKSSKLLFMDKDENVRIINMDLGTWDEGIWYSNGSYRLPAKRDYNYNDNRSRWGQQSAAGFMQGSEDNSKYESVPNIDWNMPPTIGHAKVMRIKGPNIGKIWDYKTNENVYPWLHSSKEVREEAMADESIMKHFPAFHTNKQLPGTKSLADLAKGYDENRVLPRIDYDYCWECGNLVYSEIEKDEHCCAYCKTVGMLVTLKDKLKSEEVPHDRAEQTLH